MTDSLIHSHPPADTTANPQNPEAKAASAARATRATDLVLTAEGISKTYIDGQKHVQVLKHVDVHVQAGERVAVVGASGSGKSTLLHILGGLDNPSSGTVSIAGQAMHALSSAGRGKLRNRSVGVVYQFHHLMPELTALENVAFPLRIARVGNKTSRIRARQWLERVGLGHRVDHLPSQLSGGERQRCAVARALSSQPAIVLADEPTGSLDRNNAQSISRLIQEISDEHNMAFLIATHDQELAGEMDRQIVLENGVTDD